MTESSLAAFAGKTDLASGALGGRAVLASDDFFAEKEGLLRPEPAVFVPDKYTDRGKWMDGWESRRKRVPGHDWCIVQLGVPGRIHGVDIDTSHFLGNHPPFASLEAASVPAGTTAERLRDEVDWVPILPQVSLKRGSSNLHAVGHPDVFSHVRLSIYPDGGVARLRVFGDPSPDLGEEECDLAGLQNGARALACSDMFFASMDHLLLPGKAAHMGKGWETRRSRPPGEDWLIVALGAPGHLARVTLDTNHFKGNYPDRAAVDALYWPDAPPSYLVNHPDWEPILTETRLAAHQERTWPVSRPGPFTHVRLRIFPDGGVSRMRVWGRPTREVPRDRLTDWLNALPTDQASTALHRCCGSRRWVRGMLAARPFTSRTHLLGAADAVWWALGDGDWREAFAHHPRLGTSTATGSFSASEQAGTAGAEASVLHALAQGNREYETRFGHVFLVCATGLSADEMLARLRDRIDREPWAELRVAAGEVAKITALRLAKLEPAP